MLKNFLTPTLLVLAATLSWWYIKTLDKSLAQKPAATTKGPDYFMYDTVSTIMDETGEPKHRLKTAYLAHFSEDNRTELQQADLTLHQQDGSLWSIKANRGTLFQETEQLYLAGNVTIERPPQMDAQVENGTNAAATLPPEQSGIKIQTERLHVDPNLQIAQTEDPVVISNPAVQVNAIGMKANLQTKSVELLAKVRGVYEPQH
ncbi:MAG: LPS export ABC transporter periplasmic protein LptC [Gammaproteobacteria bacterium]|jgi:lipopolysaccharide export system protein LptC|nr:LPS export ABC transporter periplasmic protein LptC [Gammaproteobacteria bacterium]